jgi:chemotaxis response regulator CheB
VPEAAVREVFEWVNDDADIAIDALGLMPAATPATSSRHHEYSNAVGVLPSGMGADRARGMLAMRTAGGSTIA